MFSCQGLWPCSCPGVWCYTAGCKAAHQEFCATWCEASSNTKQPFNLSPNKENTWPNFMLRKNSLWLLLAIWEVCVANKHCCFPPMILEGNSQWSMHLLQINALFLYLYQLIEGTNQQLCIVSVSASVGRGNQWTINTHFLHLDQVIERTSHWLMHLFCMCISWFKEPMNNLMHLLCIYTSWEKEPINN